ncbi:MAG: PD40 domain-containing protein [Candidatus Zixiibacteriota bacterium]|nr:MAG: PD40 domain-containing protein [candidate division Zixibacteria bacterium]
MRSGFNMLGLAVGCLCLLIGGSAVAVGEDTTAVAADSAESDEPKEWDVAVPAVPGDTLEFEVSEGTWISCDVHPDGSRIVFDLLGDIYTVSIDGGEATLVSGGLPYEVQPRYSPDGSRILFTSDRGGGDNVWVMDSDGTNRRAVTKETFRLLNNGIWHPGGEFIVARKHFTSGRSIGAGEAWMYRLDEGGNGIKLTSRKNQQQDAGEFTFSPDGKYLYWSEDMSGGETFEYNKDANTSIYWIRRLDMETNEIVNLIRFNGGAIRPTISPDGKTMAFVRRVRAKSVLCLYNLETGEVRHLYDKLDRDQQETWAIFGPWPGFDWTPDGKELVFWSQGKIHRIDVSTAEVREIPFTARVKQFVAKALRFPPDLSGETSPVKVIRWAQVTPDGSKVIFQALGYIYEHDIESGGCRRLTRQTDEYEFAPEISPDGKKIVYVTWNDRAGGRVKTMDLNGGSGRTVVAVPGHYATASLSPEGNWVVYRRTGGDGYRGRIWDDAPGIYIIDSEGRESPRLLTREGSAPRFAKDGERVYLISRDGGQNALISVNLLGSDRRVHVTSEHAGDFRLSPDEKWLAFEELWQTYVVPFPQAPTPVSIGPNMKNLPVRRLSKDGGTYLSWSADSRSVHWNLGPELSMFDLDSLYKPVEVKEESTEGESESSETEEEQKKPEAVTIFLGWDEPVDVPATDVYLVGGRILPMHDLSVIENGVVHVTDNLITEVGTVGEITVPDGAATIDCSGKTILPGFVDIHSHVGSSNNSIYAQQNWGLLANLAFGVTTIHDPSNYSEMIFAAAELVRKGELLGPRIFSTGTILYGAEGDFKTVINKYEDAVSAVKRTAAWGAISVKSYQQPRRNQRQMVIKAGRELGIMVIPEGGSTLTQNISQLLDGHTTLEHNIPVAPLYEPELRLLGRFGTGYTPTLVVCYGGLSGEKYFYQHTDVWANERLLTFVPRSYVDPRARRRDMTSDDEYHHITVAETAAEVVRRGGNVQMGSHGQMQGLAAHWETWMFAQGGMTNHEALRAATWMGARSIGLDGQLGSIQAGLLADLIVVNGDPTQDIYLSENIAYTMINGRLYDATTMDQLEPEKIPLPPGPFTDEVTRSDIGHIDCGP